jgi:NADPH:quinone reductase-like Zn-dependent oxidoreductase
VWYGAVMNDPMKAWQISQKTASKLEMGDRPVPSAGLNDVVIRLSAASLNYRDLLVRDQTYRVDSGTYPLIPLSDGVGEIVEIGKSVTQWKLGDRVAGAFRPKWIDGALTEEASESALGAGEVDGVLAEYVALPASGVLAPPAHLTDVEAACLPCAGVTAWNALFVTYALKPGETVLVLGTGGVSLFALQFAKLAGARVILTSSEDSKLERARSLGADETINYRTNPDWPAKVAELTGGRGVDLAIDVVGGKGSNPVLKCVRLGGTIAVIGVIEGFEGPLSTIDVIRRAIRLQGISVGSLAMFHAMNRAIARAQLRPIVDRVFPFAEAREAYAHLASGRHFGKVVIQR